MRKETITYDHVRNKIRRPLKDLMKINFFQKKITIIPCVCSFSKERKHNK